MDKQTKPMYSMFLILSGAILVVIEYYYQYPWWVQHGGSNTLLEQLVYGTWKSGTLEQEGFVRFCCLFFCAIGVVIRQGDSKDSKWVEVLAPLLSGLAVFMTVQYWSWGFAYVFLTLCSYVAFLVGAILLGRKFRSFSANLPDYNDTFPQCEELIENELSVNIPIKYQLDGQMRDAYINVVSPQRGCMVLGTPGSGKTYSIYGPFIRQMIQKQYSLFVYDYKYPDLTKRVLNELLDNYDCYDIKPKMYIVNFDDPLHSHRFNPIHPRYLTDPVDSTEISELIMKNVNRGDGTNGNDFFAKSAQCYIDLLIWFLKIYDNGKYCTFPHLIELIGKDYRDVLHIMEQYDELEVKRNTFADAIRDQAFEQIQGQIASARVPLNRFASKTLYWTLSGDDFGLDINNPKAPKIVCVGNNPKRQSIYGTTLALLTSQLFKQINNPGKHHCGVLIDELPTIYLKGLDNLIDTARQNKVAVVIGAQDKSQLVRDYDTKESDVIFNTVGNVFAGAVKGDTADDLSRSFGKEDREQRSYQEGGPTDHITYSYQLRDLLPGYKIEALSQGYFCGYVADTFKQHVHPKIFCGEVQAGEPPKHNEDIPVVVRMSKRKMNEEVEKNYKKIRMDINRIVHAELAKLDKKAPEGEEIPPLF
ncbi:MAG: type IV secretory system conjugative DNA transfer family protein [Bacteroidales bacterium]|nr:type IV secretory system conjugative DNA transfer family protein [Bacteroidales bacterium]